MHSVSDLTTAARKTTGDVPPKLVGASTTVVGDKMYLFGGRLVTERRMTSDLYVFDLETCVWARVTPSQQDAANVPGARYFHSCDTWNNHLVVFGGMGHKPEQNGVTANTDDLCVLNDVRFFDLATRRWLPPDETLGRSGNRNDDDGDPVIGRGDDPRSSSPDPLSDLIPRARYAHLSSVTGSRLFIIGGQDLNNLWLDDVCVFDLAKRQWVARRPYPRHSGTYRSVAVAAALRVRNPVDEAKARAGGDGGEGALGLNVNGGVKNTPGQRFADGRPVSSKGASAEKEYTPSENLLHLPYSTEATDEYPNDIYLYSNYNFTDVKRELEVFTPLPGGTDFTMSDRSSSMSGAMLPPGLRFPTGAICGNHLIFAGTYLAHSYQSFSIWALDLQTMSWTRLDPGITLSQGSWFKGCLWTQPASSSSKFVIFGNSTGNLVEDYNRRLLSWDDVAVIDLEAFGIYQPPKLVLDIKAQELGLAALEEELLADFEVVCDDGRKIRCSRKVLEARWPWFKEQRRLLLLAATKALESIPSSESDVPMPPSNDGDPIDRPEDDSPTNRVDPRLTPRSLLLSEPFPVTMGLLQYFYTMAIVTPLQHAPAVLSQLLLLSVNYNIPHLQGLVKHAMHRALTPTTCVGVYEVATLCGCQSLQIRALKSVMSSRKSTGRNRGNSNQGNSGSGPEGGNGGGGPPGRARGMSDLRGIARMDGSGYGNTSSVAGTYGSDAGTTNGRQFNDIPKDRFGLPSPPPSSNHPPLSFNPSRFVQTHNKRATNLSMDTLYLALNAAEEEYQSPVEASPIPGPSSFRGDFESDTERSDRSGKRELRHASSSPSLNGQPLPQTNRLPYRRSPSQPHVDTTHLHSPVDFDTSPYEDRALRDGAQISRVVSPPPSQPSSARARTNFEPQPRGMSMAESNYRRGATGLPPSTRLAATRSQHSDSDTPSLMSTSSGFSGSSYYGANGGARARNPTLSPESPQVTTPQDPFGYSTVKEAVPLSSIDEGSIYDDQPMRSQSPYSEKTRSGSYFHHSPHNSQSINPHLSMSTTDSESLSAKSSKGMFGLGMLSNKTLRMEREAAKARAKAEKLEKKAQEKALQDQREFEILMQSDGRQVLKAQKEEAKRRKKQEEKERLERLAESLKAKKTAKKDAGSVFSSSSSEIQRRKQANEWLDQSDGMYGAVGGWGGL